MKQGLMDRTVKQKIDTLRSGHGTIVFFEDQQGIINRAPLSVTLKQPVVQNAQDRYPTYSESLLTWSVQSSAIAQYAVWLAFTEASGQLGITLQHYYPDMVEVRRKWEIPDSWAMTGQMPFGRIVSPPIEKSHIHETDLIRVYQ